MGRSYEGRRSSPQRRPPEWRRASSVVHACRVAVRHTSRYLFLNPKANTSDSTDKKQTAQDKIKSVENHLAQDKK